MYFSFFIISSDFHSSVYKINNANSQSATKIFKFIDIFGLWSLGTLEKKLCTITFSTIYISGFCWNRLTCMIFYYCKCPKIHIEHCFIFQHRLVKSLYNMHQCLRCIFGHLQWLQSLHITLANPRLAVIGLHTKLQLFSLSVSRDNWSWLQHFWPRLNRFNPNLANPPI